MADLSKAVKISIQIQENKEKLESLPYKVREIESELQDFQQSYQSKKELFDQEETQKQTLIRKLEEERQAFVEKEQRLNSIKTQKEFQAVSREISNLKNSLKDDEASLETLKTKLEDLNAELSPLGEKLQNLQAQQQEEQGKIANDLQEVETNIENLEKELQETLAALPQEIQQKYHRIAAVCQPPAALVVEGTCQECFIQLPPQLFIELQRKTEIIACPSCRRLLYIDSIDPE